jgi:hypothetical protein
MRYYSSHHSPYLRTKKIMITKEGDSSRELKLIEKDKQLYFKIAKEKVNLIGHIDIWFVLHN